MPTLLEVSPNPIALTQAASQQLTTVVRASDGTVLSNVAIQYESADADVAEVTSAGLVTASGTAGSTTIRVEAAGLEETVPVTVSAVAGSVAVTPATASVGQGATVQLTASVSDLAGDPVPSPVVTWESLNPAAATVSPTGLVTAVGPAGPVTIRASSGGAAGTADLSVTQVATSLTVYPAALRLARSTSRQLAVTVRDLVGTPITGASVTFSSNAPATAAVSSGGLVQAGAADGTTQVRVAAGSAQLDVPVEVAATTSPLGDIVAEQDLPGAYAVAISSSGRIYLGSSGGTLHAGLLPDFALTPVPVDAGPVRGLAFEADAAHLWVGNLPNGEASRVTEAGSVVGSTLSALDGSAVEVRTSADGLTAWVGTDANRLYAVDAATRFPFESWTFGFAPRHVHVGSDNHLYVSGGVRGITRIGSSPTAMYTSTDANEASVLSPDGSRLYTAMGTGYVAIISIPGGTVIVQRAVGGCDPWDMAASPDGRRLFVTCPGAGALKILSLPSLDVERTVDLPTEPRRLAFSADGTWLVVAAGTKAYLLR